VSIRASSSKQIESLVADLGAARALTRDAAVARLTVIGSRAVERLIARAVAAGIDAAIVEAETFDEVMGDVLRQTPALPSELLAAAERDAPRVGAAPPPAAGTSWPVVRTNALPVIEYPSVCRLVESSIGGVKDVRAAVDLAQVGDELVIGRCNAGVLAFGSDPALQKVLANHEPSRTDLHAIEASPP